MAIWGMFSTIKERLNLSNIEQFSREECEDRLMLIRYLLRREDSPGAWAEFNPYILRIERRLKELNSAYPDL